MLKAARETYKRFRAYTDFLKSELSDELDFLYEVDNELATVELPVHEKSHAKKPQPKVSQQGSLNPMSKKNVTRLTHTCTHAWAKRWSGRACYSLNDSFQSIVIK